MDMTSYHPSLKHTGAERTMTWYHHLYLPCRSTQRPIDRAEATRREVSSWVGDHQRIPPVVCISIFAFIDNIDRYGSLSSLYYIFLQVCKVPSRCPYGRGLNSS